MQVTQVAGRNARKSTAHDAKHHQGAHEGLRSVPGTGCRLAQVVSTPGVHANARSESASHGGTGHRHPYCQEKHCVAQHRKIGTCFSSLLR